MKKIVSAIASLLSWQCFAQSPSAAVFQWVDTLSPSCSVNAIVTDQLGNEYITGQFSGTVDFDPGPGTYTLSSAAPVTFIARLTSAKNLVWAKQLSSNAYNLGRALCLHNQQELIVTGVFTGMTDFDPGPGTNTISVTKNNSYILKLDTAGNFTWAGNIECNQQIQPSKIETDNAGNIYTSGTFNDTTDFDPGPSTFTLTTPNYAHGYLLKLSPVGNFIWATSIGINASVFSFGLEVDQANNIYTTGFFSGTIDKDPGPAVDTVSSTSGWSAYIIKYNTSGTADWIKVITDTFYTKGATVCSDGAGNIYTTGTFLGVIDLDPGPGVYTVSAAGGFGVYMIKLDGQGNFVSGKSFNSGAITTLFLERTQQNNFIMAGCYNISIDLGTAGTTINSNGYADVFVSELDPNMNVLWGRSWGGSQDEYCMGLSLAGPEIYTVGSYQGAVDMDPGAGAYPVNSGTLTGCFVHKMMECCVGVDEKQEDDASLSLYPNPTSGKFIVNAQVIAVYDVLGNVIYSSHHSPGAEIDLSDKSRGIYFVELKKGETKIVKKVVLE